MPSISTPGTVIVSDAGTPVVEGASNLSFVGGTVTDAGNGTASITVGGGGGGEWMTAGNTLAGSEKLGSLNSQPVNFVYNNTFSGAIVAPWLWTLGTNNDLAVTVDDPNSGQRASYLKVKQQGPGPAVYGRSVVAGTYLTNIVQSMSLECINELAVQFTGAGQNIDLNFVLPNLGSGTKRTVYTGVIKYIINPYEAPALGEYYVRHINYALVVSGNNVSVASSAIGYSIQSAYFAGLTNDPSVLPGALGSRSFIVRLQTGLFAGVVAANLKAVNNAFGG